MYRERNLQRERYPHAHTNTRKHSAIMGRSTLFLVLAIVVTFFSFGLACSLFALATDVPSSGQKWGAAFRGIWFFFFPVLLFFTWYKPSHRFVAFCWGAAAFLSLAALALGGEYTDGVTRNTNTVKAVCAFGYLTWLILAAFCVIVAIKRKSLADDDEDSDSLKKGDSSASAPQPTVVHGGQASQPSMGGPGVAPKSQV